MRWGRFGRGTGFLLAMAAVSLVRCDGGDDDPGVRSQCKEPFPSPSAIFYDEESGASDEALERVWDKLCLADTSEALAPAITSPRDGEVLSTDSPFEITWESGIVTLVPGGGKEAPGLAHPRGRRLAFGFPVAHAHMPPVTGTVHLIELRPADGASLWAFVKREREDRKAFTPEGAFWERIKELEGTIELYVTSVHLRENVVDEGPYTSSRPVVVRLEGP